MMATAIVACLTAGYLVGMISGYQIGCATGERTERIRLGEALGGLEISRNGNKLTLRGPIERLRQILEVMEWVTPDSRPSTPMTPPRPED